MNSKQINKNRMYGTTILVLDNNLALVEAIPELAAAHQQLKEKMALIDQERQVQEVRRLLLALPGVRPAGPRQAWEWPAAPLEAAHRIRRCPAVGRPRRPPSPAVSPSR